MGSEVPQEKACKGCHCVWGGGFRVAERPGRQRAHQKFCKKSMKNFEIFKKFSSKFRDCFNFFNFIDFFSENLDKKLENLEICIYRGFAWRSLPDVTEFIEISVEKSMKTSKFCIVLNERLLFFQFVKRILSNFSRKLCE